MRRACLGALVLGLGCQLFVRVRPEDFIEQTPQLCDDGVDNDEDGALDCQDPKCVSFCPEPSKCGNGDLDAGEQCDDANLLAGDGCSAECQFECIEDSATACFLPEQTISLQGNGLALKSAKLNSDENLDLAVTTSGGLEILLGAGDSSFSSFQLLPTSATPNALDISDANGDGALDIAVAAQDADVITVFFGDGQGAFPTNINLLTEDGPSAVIFADLNADSLSDIVAACEARGAINSFLAQAGNSFSLLSSDNSLSGPNSLAAGLVNGDAFIDVVSANFGDSNLHIFVGNNLGNLNANSIVPTGSSLETIALADVNNDTSLDFITTSNDLPEVRIQTRDVVTGDVIEQKKVALESATFGHHSLLAQDINEDNEVDLIVLTSAQTTIFLGNGSGSFSLAAALIGAGSAVASGDINNDGKIDVVVTEKDSPGLRVFIRQP